MQLRTLLVILSILLAGCAPSPSGRPTEAFSRGHHVVVHPYLATSRLPQALVPTKTLEDIYYLDVMPLVDPGDGQFHVISKATGEPLEVFEGWRWRWDQVVYHERSLPRMSFNKSIEFSGLKANGRYRLQAMAFGRDGYILSRNDASSAVDLVLDDDDTFVSDVSLPIQLMDTPFGASFNLTLSPTGAFTRLTGMLVTIKRAGTDATPPQEVARISLSTFDLQSPVLVSHLNAQTRYVIEIEPQVSGEGAQPASQSFEVQVGQDDALPDREVEVPIPAL